MQRQFLRYETTTTNQTQKKKTERKERKKITTINTWWPPFCFNGNYAAIIIFVVVIHLFFSLPGASNWRQFAHNWRKKYSLWHYTGIIGSKTNNSNTQNDAEKKRERKRKVRQKHYYAKLVQLTENPSNGFARRPLDGVSLQQPTRPRTPSGRPPKPSSSPKPPVWNSRKSSNYAKITVAPTAAPIEQFENSCLHVQSMAARANESISRIRDQYAPVFLPVLFHVEISDFLRFVLWQH